MQTDRTSWLGRQDSNLGMAESKIRSPTSRLTRRTESLPPVVDGGTHGKMAARDSGSGSATILKHFGIGDKDER